MADTMKLTFLTDLYTQVTLNVPYPNRSVQDNTVKTAMSNIIASGALMIKNAVPMSRISAELLTQDEAPFSI